VGAAPFIVALIESTGKSTSGIWLMPILSMEIVPKMISPDISIQAKTGRRMES